MEEKLKARIVELQQTEKRLWADLNFILGRIEELNFMLEELKKEEPEDAD